MATAKELADDVMMVCFVKHNSNTCTCSALTFIIVMTAITWCKRKRCKTTERSQKWTLMSCRNVPEVKQNRRNGGKGGSSVAAGMMTKTVP